MSYQLIQCLPVKALYVNYQTSVKSRFFGTNITFFAGTQLLQKFIQIDCNHWIIKISSLIYFMQI